MTTPPLKRPPRFRTLAILAIPFITLFGEPQHDGLSADEIRFVDAAADVGLDFRHRSPLTPERHLHLFMGSGVGWLDYDGDGWPDLYAAQGAAFPRTKATDPAHSDQLFRNRQGQFASVAVPAGLQDFEYSMGVAVGDFDNDGFADLFVSAYGPNSLYHNNGDGTFSQVDDQPILADPRFGASCTWADIDADGDLDLYVTNYLKLDPENYPLCSHHELGKRYPGGCHPRYQQHEHDQLLRNNGDGTFADISQESGILAETPRAGLGVVLCDFDDDGDTDFYVANDTVNNQLWVNDGKGAFVDDALLMGVAVNGFGVAEAGMGVVSGDIDRDGLMDLFVTNYFNETNTFYRNDRLAFTDVTAEFGLAAPSKQRLGFGTSLFDADNDGALDIFVANGHVQSYPPELDRKSPFAQLQQFYHNIEGRRFEDISASCGLYFQQPRVGRSSAVADFNKDGRPDLAVLHLNDRLALLRNETAAIGNRATFHFVGRTSNRDAIGARIMTTMGDRTTVQFCQGSQGYLSSDFRRMSIALGSANQVDSMQVRWPSGMTESWTALAAGEDHVLREGTGRAE